MAASAVNGPEGEGCGGFLDGPERSESLQSATCNLCPALLRRH
jgi:hypothetical protein